MSVPDQLGMDDETSELLALGDQRWGTEPPAIRRPTLAAQIDQIVVAPLWVEVRTFPWRRLTKVAANVLMNTRAGVAGLRKCWSG